MDNYWHNVFSFFFPNKPLMKGVILLAVMHILIIYQSQKRQTKKNNVSEPSFVTTQPEPAPQPGSSSATPGIKASGYLGYGQAFYFMTNAPHLRAPVARLF